MLSNETIKRRLRKGLEECGMYENPIMINKIKFSGVVRQGKKIQINKIQLSLDDICGIQLDSLKCRVDEILSEINVDYNGLLLDV